MAGHYDDLEVRAPDAREADLMAALREHVTRAKTVSPLFAERLASVNPEKLTDRDALARLPLLHKGDLSALQAAAPPFGGLTDEAPGGFRRLYLSPGPITEPEAHREHWRMARALHAAGFRARDIVANCFAYHLTPAGFMFDHAAAALGCAVFPGGVGNTDAQTDALQRLGITAYVGTPDFLRTIIERADERGIETRRLTRGLVTGGPFFASLRDWYRDRGVAVRQCYGTAELGLIAYEAADAEDGLVLDEQAIVEIVRPGTGDPVPEGEVGEVVVTTFNPAYPLIRFATGDLSAIMPGRSPCGRTNARLRGWMGRADQTTKVRGMFVHPAQVARIVETMPTVSRARLEVTETEGRDTLTLKVVSAERGEDLAARLAEAVREECRLRGEIVFAQDGDLPNDGKVIADLRTPV